jgi:uncharacterized protein YllA (UPF0747 family)
MHTSNESLNSILNRVLSKSISADRNATVTKKSILEYEYIPGDIISRFDKNLLTENSFKERALKYSDENENNFLKNINNYLTNIKYNNGETNDN